MKRLGQSAVTTIRNFGKTALLTGTTLGMMIVPAVAHAGQKSGANSKTSVTVVTTAVTDSVAPPPAPAPAPPADPTFYPLAGNIRSFAGDLSGTAGNIRSFAGDGTASAGNIRSFAGNIRSFAGNIRSFQAEALPTNGTNSAFWGSLSAAGGVATPSAGNIRSFSGDLDALAGNIRSFAGNIRSFDGTLLTYSQAPAAYGGIAKQITDLVAKSKSTWGNAVQAETGKTFEAAFSNPMLAKYGIDLKKPATLYGLNEVGLELFLLDWNDNLMNYSGRDQVDHWMKEINWTPSLTQQVTGGGLGTKIGLLDFTVVGLETGAIVNANGISTVAGGHGTAVASLIFAPHDGKGVMGIAPKASVMTYNPFDSTYTAGWDDIRTGIDSFVDNGVSVVNLSLGVPGWTLSDGWAKVFAPGSLDNAIMKQMFVFAAGNDGKVQPRDITWDVDKAMTFIVVGSVDPNGKISAFSNTPGTTCLLRAGSCASGDLLMDHFMVAPGEFMLVTNEQGGVTRMSGTSFAAPLVSGTAALIADRWPWLSMFNNDIADIILDSATDLGEAGVDGDYGHGLLNVQAALSPLDFSKLQWTVMVNNTMTSYSATQLGAIASSSKATWEANSAYLTVYESTANSFRDFKIPLSSKLAGQTVGLGREQFMAYLSSRFWTWVNSGAAKAGKSGFAAFTDAGPSSPLQNFGNVQASLSMRPRAYRPGLRQDHAAFDSAMTLQTADTRVRFDFGTGHGAPALTGMSGFGLQSDYDLQTGGTNPLLGLASGSGYASINYRLAGKVTASAGFTHRNAVRDPVSGPQGGLPLGAYKANAFALAVAYKPNDWVRASLGYTMLDEKDALLGMQSADANDFRGGNRTDAATIGVELTPENGIALAASATVGRTRQGDSSKQNLRAGSSGIVSSAFQVSLAKTKVLAGNDSLRLSVSQPLHIDRGAIDFSGVEVIDRQTGELGVVTQHIALKSPPRSHVVETVYRLPLMDGAASFSLFGKMRMGGIDQNAGEARATGGIGFDVKF